MFKVLCATADECRDIVDGLNNVIRDYGYATMADLCDLRGLETVSKDEICMGWVKQLDLSCVIGELSFELRLPDPVYVALADDSNREVDMVNHPPHYQTESGLEAVQVIEAFTAKLSGIEAVDTGNVLKYVCRWKEKNGLEDLKKAKWYLEHLINHIEKENDNHE